MDSPLKAFENEVADQASVGLWDFSDFFTDGDTDAFQRRRRIQIKHGLVEVFRTPIAGLHLFLACGLFCESSGVLGRRNRPLGGSDWRPLLFAIDGFMLDAQGLIGALANGRVAMLGNIGFS